MSVKHLAVVGLLSFALADVGPRCGRRGERSEVTVHKAWEDCGWHGPRHRLDCAAPAVCIQLAKPLTVTTGNVTTSSVCSAACTSDADCAKLGAGYRCTGEGHPYFESANAPKDAAVCVRTGDGG